MLARNFGIKVNADAFEVMAQTVPVTILTRHRGNIQQLEALLLGQANLLTDEPKDEYSQLLQREYQFFQNKFSLTPIATPVHFLRMRPGNFPTIRLAQLAMLVHMSSHLFSKILEEPELKSLLSCLQVTAGDYWNTHYRLGTPAALKTKNLGSSMAENLVINTLVPTLFACGMYQKQESYKDKAMHWLQALSAECNSITDAFVQHAVENKSAYDSQALIELKHEYCDQKRCLQCGVGNALLKTCV